MWPNRVSNPAPLCPTDCATWPGRGCVCVCVCGGGQGYQGTWPEKSAPNTPGKTLNAIQEGS